MRIPNLKLNKCNCIVRIYCINITHHFSWGGLMMFGSYNKFHNKINIDAAVVSSLDFITSLIASCVIFSVLGSLSLELDIPVEHVADGGQACASRSNIGEETNIFSYRALLLWYTLRRCPGYHSPGSGLSSSSSCSSSSASTLNLPSLKLRSLLFTTGFLSCGITRCRRIISRTSQATSIRSKASQTRLQTTHVSIQNHTQKRIVVHDSLKTLNQPTPSCGRQDDVFQLFHCSHLYWRGKSYCL